MLVHTSEFDSPEYGRITVMCFLHAWGVGSDWLPVVLIPESLKHVRN